MNGVSGTRSYATRLLRPANLVTVALLALLYFAGQWVLNAHLLNPFYQTLLFTIGINIILAVSLNLVNGFLGQLSLGHAGFMAIGAYTAGALTVKLGLPLVVAVVSAAAAAGLAGLLVGLPTLRLRGDYLAIATLGFGEIVRSVLYNVDYVGGATGLIGIPQLTTWPWLFGMVLVTVLVVKNLAGSSHGRAIRAIAADEVAAEDSGIATTRYKVLGFAISSALAGIGGALYAHYFYIIQPTTFSFLKSFDILVFVVLGGLGSVTGSIISATALSILNAELQQLAAWRMVIYGLALVLMMIYRRSGLMGESELSFAGVSRFLAGITQRRGQQHGTLGDA